MKEAAAAAYSAELVTPDAKMKARCDWTELVAPVAVILLSPPVPTTGAGLGGGGVDTSARGSAEPHHTHAVGQCEPRVDM